MAVLVYFRQHLELISDSFGQAGKTVPQAIARLKAKLKSLLASSRFILTR